MSLIKKPSERDSNIPITCLIYGQPSTGKTSLGLSSSKPLLFDFDNGIHRIKNKYQTDSVTRCSYIELMNILNSDDIKEFDTLVFDTVGRIIDILNEHIRSDYKLVHSDGTPTIQGWGKIKSLFSNISKTAMSTGKNLIFISHEKIERRKEGKEEILFSIPDIPGSSGNELIKDIDLMGYMKMTDDVRTISFSPTSAFYAKNSLELPGIIKIPDNEKVNNFFEKFIVESTMKKRKENAELMVEYTKLKQENYNMINKINTLDDANTVYNELINKNIIWDSKDVWRNDLNIHISKKGFIFNKETKAFEENEKEEKHADNSITL